MRRPLSWLWFGLGACSAPSDSSVDTDTDTPAQSCLCEVADTCCDGCLPVSGATGCAGEGQARWFACERGVCEEGGTRSTWSMPDGAWVHHVSIAGEWRVAGWQQGLDGDDGGFVLWSDGAEVRSMTGAAVHGVDVTDTGHVAVCAGDVLTVYDPDGDAIFTSSCQEGAVAFSPDALSLAASGPDGVDLYTLTGDPQAWSLTQTLPHPREEGVRMWSIRWSASGDRLLSGTGQAGFGSPSGEGRLWSLETTEEPLAILSCTSMDLDFGPDGAIAGACWTDVRIFDADGDLVRSLGVSGPALSVSWADDGRLFAGLLQLGVAWFNPGSTAADGGMWAGDTPGSPKTLRLLAAELTGAGWDGTPLTLWNLNELGAP